MSNFYTSPGHFQMTFPNGYTISIFNGPGSYTENHFNMELLKKQCDGTLNEVHSDKVEIGILFGGQLVTKNLLKSYDNVIAEVDPSELLEIIDKVREVK